MKLTLQLDDAGTRGVNSLVSRDKQDFMFERENDLAESQCAFFKRASGQLMIARFRLSCSHRSAK